MQRTGDFVSQVLGPRMVADTGEWGTYAWGRVRPAASPGMRVAGGTDEVMRNIVSERVLGLPKEPGIDTTSPFKVAGPELRSLVLAARRSRAALHARRGLPRGRRSSSGGP